MSKTGFTLAAAAATLFSAGAMMLAPTAASASEGVHCMGVNACKGQSACKTASSACKGLNECKGQGFIVTPDEAACTTAGGTVG
ncbi:hypothetical protein L2U69_00635 [Zavarzinia compransoris]|uniref:BufA2 family periplasmic bufferin-type metallophore n=1 Tax=Zavarzinia marina TaxID=2911065 RepID=UPI001F1D1D7D|nr:hypothetical protein [Zavarzinia marina]MCF4164149.1 hypothetical protein [Zavarzinia marina]